MIKTLDIDLSIIMYDKTLLTQLFHFLSRPENRKTPLRNSEYVTSSIPIALLVVRSGEEGVLEMVLAVEVLAYEPQHITDKPWPSLPTKVKVDAILALDKLLRNSLPWKTILTASLTDDNLRAHTLLFNSSRIMVSMTLTVSDQPMATLVVSCTRPDTAAFD